MKMCKVHEMVSLNSLTLSQNGILGILEFEMEFESRIVFTENLFDWIVENIVAICLWGSFSNLEEINMSNHNFLIIKFLWWLKSIVNKSEGNFIWVIDLVWNNLLGFAMLPTWKLVPKICKSWQKWRFCNHFFKFYKYSLFQIVVMKNSPFYALRLLFTWDQTCDLLLESYTKFRHPMNTRSSSYFIFSTLSFSVPKKIIGSSQNSR